MRPEPTASERKLRRELNNLGLYPKTQYTIDKMTVDFCFPEYNLVIEVDGSIHNKPAIAAKDKKRNYILECKGYTVLRFTNAAITNSVKGVCLRIQSTIAALT